MKFPILYSLSATGKIIEWKIETQDNKVIVVWGEKDGKKQKTIEVVTKGTNIGKKNERNKIQQAQFIAESKWKAKQARQGYVSNISILRKGINNMNMSKKNGRETDKKIGMVVKPHVIRPMLAQKYQDMKSRVEYPVFLQPKLDGIRCLANSTCMMSRKGLLFHGLQHIQKQIHSLYEANKSLLKTSNLYVDGELYQHGKSFQQIQSTVLDQKENPLKKEMQYWIYDCFDLNNMNMQYWQRYQLLKKMFENAKKQKIAIPNLVFIDTYTIKNEKEMMRYHLDLTSKHGFEGVMIRNSSGLYRLKHRSVDLLKYKSFQDDEYKIIGFKEGKGKDKGTVIWKVETKKGQPFFVRPGGTLEERKELFKNGKKYIGKMLNVRFIKLSDDDIPQHILKAVIRHIM